ncbi:MAG: type IV pilus secretin PilQ [Pseudomarimonas sp.]
MTATKPKTHFAAYKQFSRQLATCVVLASLSVPALAANTLREITYSPGANGVVDIILQLDGPASDAQVFTTDDPPRIAIDLVDTANGVEQKRIAVGSGATSAITAVEAGGKTRVVVDLFYATTYDARAEGNRYVVRVEGGKGKNNVDLSTAVNPDPAKRPPASGLAISNVDFRRGDSGAGKVVLSFSGDGVSADLADSGNGLLLDVANASLPDALAQRLDVTDFATPVETVELRATASGATLRIATTGRYESLAYQSGNEYVIEVTPVVETEELALGVEGEPKGYTGTPVTFNFQDIPVRTVLQLVAEESGRNVVASDSVTGNVTLRLINVPWDQALDIVLRAKGLDQREDGNVVWIAPQTEIAAYEQALADARLANEQRAKTVSEYIPINYGNAEEIAKLLTEDARQGGGGGGQSGAGGGAGGGSQRGFLSPRGSVTFDKRTNTLLVNDSEEKIREVKALIAVLDRPVDQVLIEARIVVASESFRRELGARFGVSGSDEAGNGDVITTTGSANGADEMTNLALTNRLRGRSSGLPTSAFGEVGQGVLVPTLADRLNVNLPVTSPAGAIGFAILGADYLIDLELSALEAEGRGEVVTSPRVITANQREAIIRQGDEVGFTTLQPGAAGGGAQFTTEFKQVLLELKVTPTITQDGRVFLVLQVKKDELTGFFQSPTGRIPEISTREISTAVLVDNAQTVVIGGVYEFRSAEDLTKVPFLGDVPVLGNLFKTKSKNSDKAELLIFVTPKVLPVAGKRP